MILSIIQLVGREAIKVCNTFGSFSLFFLDVLKTLFTSIPSVKKLLAQMKSIGVDSLTIILLTGASSGAVLALQTYFGFRKFGAEEFIGPIVAFSLTRELGPVLTGLMVAGRAGSAIAAELGTMQITEQIDALKTLSIDVNKYLMIPRILGGTIILPFLAVFSMICGIAGGYLICVYHLHLNGEQYLSGIRIYLELSDITGGLIKASVFGFILSIIGCYKGFSTNGGAKGVGISTTQSVVTSSILILIANYFLTAFLSK